MMTALCSHPLTDAEIQAGMSGLPAVSTVMRRILGVLADPRSDLSDIARLVRAETSLAAQVVRMANSVFYGLGQPVRSIEEAIQRLGFAEVNRLVLTLNGRQLFQGPLGHVGLSVESVWQNALAVAVCAETVAGYAQLDRGLAYLGGILHPVGLLVLDRVAAARQLPAREPGQTLAEWATAYFGDHHAAVSARVLQAWALPEALVGTVAGRYEPAAAGEQRRSASGLHLASCLAEHLGAGLASEQGRFQVSAATLAAAGLELDEFGEAEIAAGQGLQRTRALLQLA